VPAVHPSLLNVADDFLDPFIVEQRATLQVVECFDDVLCRQVRHRHQHLQELADARLLVVGGLQTMLGYLQ
jgi:hypothetical protein